MGGVKGVLDQPIEEAIKATRGVAGSQGYAVAEGHEPNMLIFRKGIKLYSWGSELRVRFEESPESSETQLSIDTGEIFAITDWGRGKRAGRKLLNALGARTLDSG